MLGNLFTLVVGTAIIVGLFHVVRRRASLGTFDFRRARTAARSDTSANALLMLAAVQVAVLGFDLAAGASRLASFHREAAALVPIVLVAAVVLLVVARSLASAVIGSIGIGSALLSVGLDFGMPGVLSVVVLSMLMLFILGAVRGFLRVT